MLEIYGEEFTHLNSEQELNISKTFLRRKLRKSWTKVERLLNFYLKRQRIFFRNDPEDKSRIYYRIPKFIELASNWTKREKALPTEAPTEAPTAIEVEVDKEEELDKRKKEKERKKWLSNSFELFWNLHPGTKTGKKKCFTRWLVINPDQILFDKMMFAIEDQITWRKIAKPNDFRPEWKNPLTWLNQECWNDETQRYVKPPPRYKEIKCPNPECGKTFKKNVDLNENQCPHCYVIICKKLPPEPDKPEDRVVELSDKVVKSTQFPDDATETQH